MQLKGEVPKERSDYIEYLLICQRKISKCYTFEKFPTFFGNTWEEAKQHLFKFSSACDVFNLSKYNITCQLFAQTLHGNGCEWFYSLPPEIITSWNVLETLFLKYIFQGFTHMPLLVVFMNIPTHPLQ